MTDVGRGSGPLDGPEASSGSPPDGYRHELVSVVIPAYNAERYLARAIESVLAQTYPDLELVVVDDGSTDATASVTGEFADRRVSIVSQPNRGVAGARNAGVLATTGPLVAFLDADDYWLPAKLEVQVEMLRRHPDLAAVGCRMQYVSNTGRVLGVTGGRVGPKERRLVAEGRLGPFHVGSGTLFHREALEAAGGFDDELSANEPGQVEDRDLIAKVAAAAPIDCAQEVLAAYRIHAGSASARRYLSQCTGVRFVIERRAAEARGERLSWEQFARRHRRTPWQLRADLAGYSYRQAGVQAAERAWAKAALHLTAAGVLAPGRTVHRLWRQRPWMGWSGAGRGDGP